MSQIGRPIKNLEAPRPLKSTIKQNSTYSSNFEVNTIEDLISLTETVASGLTNGSVSMEFFNKMSSSLSIHGPQLEIISKEILDRCFIAFRNASQDDRLKISIRLNLLQLIELRANSWQISDGLNTYYKHKAATNVEPELDLNLLSTSPSAVIADIGLIGTGTLLSQGEIIKNSGKFSKPTKIPGKNYSKDEIVIRNADSGKVNPGAKERLVQITGPNEDKINYAKLLIEDTIKRNASPIREQSQEGSCSSLGSSNEDVVRLSGCHVPVNYQTDIASYPLSGGVTGNSIGHHHRLTRSSSHHNAGGPGGLLVHSLSTSDASLGEFKYTVNVGNHTIKITGDCNELVRAAKLVLDDFFTCKDFLESSDVFSNNNGTNVPYSNPLAAASQFIDSGVNLDMLAHSPSSNLLNNNCEIDDDVFINHGIDVKSNINLTSSSSVDSSSSSNTTIVTGAGDNGTTPTNVLSRSRRSHFSRKNSSPEFKPNKNDNEPRIVYNLKSMWWFYMNLPLARAKPSCWDTISEKSPNIVRDEVCTNIGDLSIGNNERSYITNNGNHYNNIDNGHIVTNNRFKMPGSGRMLKKSLSYCNSIDNYRNDETNHTYFSTNNFQRTHSSTNITCIRAIPELMAKET